MNSRNDLMLSFVKYERIRQLVVKCLVLLSSQPDHHETDTEYNVGKEFYKSIFPVR